MNNDMKVFYEVLLGIMNNTNKIAERLQDLVDYKADETKRTLAEARRARKINKDLLCEEFKNKKLI